MNEKEEIREIGISPKVQNRNVGKVVQMDDCQITYADMYYKVRYDQLLMILLVLFAMTVIYFCSVILFLI